jgi:hypothetical protein
MGNARFPKQRAVSHSPGFIREPASPVSPAVVERVLTDWFERPVVLLSSGRTGLHLFLRIKGFQRYLHRVQIPRFLARCVISALTHSAFPVEYPTAADALLDYPAFGFPRRGEPSCPVVIEDHAHAFFATAHSGARRWRGEAALFSLPKFFSTAGLAGGLVFADEHLALEARSVLESTPEEPPGVREWMRTTIVNAMELADEYTPMFIESAYELLYQFMRPSSADLAGFPESLIEIQKIGEARTDRVAFFLEFFQGTACPTEFWDVREPLLPYALPYFSSGGLERLQRAAALGELGVATGVYHLDVNRGHNAPDYRKCLLLPCHQAFPMEQFEAMCRRLKEIDR